MVEFAEKKSMLENFHANALNQEIMKVREVIPHTGPIPIIVIPLKLFLDLLRDSGIPTRVN